ncbi:hypothetical protein AnF1_00001 [Pseudomonas phage vB_PpuP-AnF1]
MKANQNTFILARAACLLVEAYQKIIPEYVEALGIKDLQVGPDAPNTYEALVADYKANARLKVSTEFNSTSIYGGSGNLTFRIMHDLGHLLYDAKFTTNDEVLLAQTQWKDLERYIPKEWVSVCREVYTADTIEQSLFEQRTGDFPADQKGFVLGFLERYFAAQWAA